MEWPCGREKASKWPVACVTCKPSVPSVRETLKIAVKILELLLAPGDNSGGFLGHVVFDPCPRR